MSIQQLRMALCSEKNLIMLKIFPSKLKFKCIKKRLFNFNRKLPYGSTSPDAHEDSMLVYQ